MGTVTHQLHDESLSLLSLSAQFVMANRVVLVVICVGGGRCRDGEIGRWVARLASLLFFGLAWDGAGERSSQQLPAPGGPCRQRARQQER
eukprot:scaffold364957_cov41-Prasinocladus_malaysianus.AAC.1